MKKLFIVLLIFPLLALQAADAQVRKVPAQVTNAFQKQYPTATDASWRDKITNFQVNFKMNNAGYLAKYGNKGEWKETEQPLDATELPAPVKDGFDKSEYANKDWMAKEYTRIYQPGNVTKYRILVRKNALEKKYLYFDVNGKMIDATTKL
jgi:hypothetical protein